MKNFFKKSKMGTAMMNKFFLFVLLMPIFVSAIDVPQTGKMPTTSGSGTDGGATGNGISYSGTNANNLTSVSGALNEAKNQNSMGMVANVVGAGLHGVEGWTNIANSKCAAVATCIYPLLVKGILHLAMIPVSFSQANAHSNSNSSLIPEICKASSSACTGNQYNWPDMSSCNGNPNCMTNAINNSGNTDLANLFDPKNSTNPLADYNKTIEKLNQVGGTFDPVTGMLKLNGKTYDTKKLLNDSEARKAAGISDAEFKKFQSESKMIDAQAASKAGASLVAAGIGSDGATNAGTSGSPKSGTNPLTGKPYGVDLDSLGGGASGEGGEFDADATAKAAALYGAKGLKDGSRVPASIAGKKKMYNGEPIGVAGDSIFDMMTRRYQFKETQNSFLDPALVDPK